MCFRRSQGLLLIGAESFGFAWWRDVGDWRGFILGRNWVYKLLHWRPGCAGFHGLLFSELRLAQSQALGLEPLWAEVTTNQVLGNWRATIAV